MTSTDNSKRNFGLDAARAVAISLVLCSHFYRPTEALGIYGVELFFVLSGFLIGGILLRTLAGNPNGFGIGDLSQFWIRRWFRTLPNYYLFLLLYFLLFPPAHGAHVGPYLVFLQNFAWPTPDFAGHTWSLTIEEWFYLLFPLTILLTSLGKHSGKNAATNRFLLATAIFVIVPSILRFTQPLWLTPQDPRMIVVCRLDAMMCGVFLAYLRRQGTRWDLLVRLWPVGLLGIAASFALISGASYAFQAFAYSVIPFSFALILPKCESLKRVGGFVGFAVERVSVWSYSLYLSHILVYFEIMRLTGYEQLGTLGKTFVKVLSLVTAFAVSAATYHFFERPCTNLRERWRSASTRNRARAVHES